jgi:hypothetical protein
VDSVQKHFKFHDRGSFVGSWNVPTLAHFIKHMEQMMIKLLELKLKRKKNEIKELTLEQFKFVVEELESLRQ